MIGSSGKVGSGHYHKHEVTKCLHESGEAKLDVGEKMGAGAKTSYYQLKQEREAFSLQEWLTGGLRGLLSRASDFWRRLGEEGTPGQDGSAGKAGKGMGTAIAGKAGEITNAISPTDRTAADDMALAAVATAMMKPETEKKEEEQESERKVKNVEGAVDGGLKREQGGIRKFLQKFGEAAAKAGQFLKKRKKPDAALIESDVDFRMGDNSFLLDSYNREGEYSTLAKDRSLEGSFRAKG